MITRNVLKNQKLQKTKNFHMKSILNQVKNKSLIEELQLEESDRLYNDYSKAIYRSKRKQKQQSTERMDRDKKQQTAKPQMKKKQSSEKGDTNNEKSKDQTTTNYQPIILLRRPSNHLQRRNSRIEVQLQEIIKYSMLYPSRSNSQKQISENMNKILNSKQKMIPKCGKSNFCKSRQYKKNINKMSIFYNRQEKSQDMCLKLIENYNTEQSAEDIAKAKNVKYLIKKSKQVMLKNKSPFDYTFSGFIQNQISQLGLKQGRRTVGITNASRDRQNLDIRDQSIQNIHRLLRGEKRQDEQFTDFMTTKEIEQFRAKYDLYKSIYKRTKDTTNTEKISINEVKQLTLKNAVFLNQSLNQCNTRQKRREIQTAMKKLHFYR